jgi:hypothetical protein
MRDCPVGFHITCGNQKQFELLRETLYFPTQKVEVRPNAVFIRVFVMARFSGDLPETQSFKVSQASPVMRYGVLQGCFSLLRQFCDAPELLDLTPAPCPSSANRESADVSRRLASSALAFSSKCSPDFPNAASKADMAPASRSWVTDSGRGMVSAGRFVREPRVNSAEKA